MCRIFGWYCLLDGGFLQDLRLRWLLAAALSCLLLLWHCEEGVSVGLVNRKERYLFHATMLTASFWF